MQWPAIGGGVYRRAVLFSYASFTKHDAMIDFRKAPPELFAQVLEGNLQGIGPVRKLYGHFVDAVRHRVGAECAWLLGEGGEVQVLRGDPGLFDLGRSLAFLRDQRPSLLRTVVLARVTVHGRQMAVVGAARRERDFGQSARRTLDRLCGVLALWGARSRRRPICWTGSAGKDSLPHSVQLSE
jgi:hypothetical protein